MLCALFAKISLTLTSLHVRI